MIGVSEATAVAAAVDADRLLERLAELARIGADSGGGVTRVAFSDLERQANDLVIDWSQELGLTVARDRFGNVFASTDGNREGARPWLSGSHIDTVPNGGRYDGALGVVAAVEAMAAILTVGALPPSGLEVVIWRSEEPVRFAQGKAGSLVFSGALQRDDLRPLGGEVEFDLPPSERDLPLRPGTRGVGGCLELHIEQGRRLERSGRRLGIVTAVASPIRLRVRLAGRADHSGATPMDDRRDALCAAAEVILRVEQLAREESEHETVATVAQATVEPGAMNVVPGAVELLVDVRGIDWSSMQRMVQRLGSESEAVAREREMRLSIEILSSSEPARFDGRVIETLTRTAVELGYEPLVMPSGAGHDAQCIQAIAPSGMLFVPSIDGISHSPYENTTAEDIVLGARALAAGWLTCAAS